MKPITPMEYKLAIRFIIGLFLLIGIHASAQQLKDPVALKTEWGGKFELCNSSSENYYIIYKNVNAFAIDLVIAVKDVSGEWKVFQKNNLAQNDTMIAFTCTGAGKSKIDFRKSGDNLPLMSYNDLNKDFLAANPPKNNETNEKKLTDIKAKLLYGEKTKKPLVNLKVGLKDEKGAILHSATTNEFGDFIFEKVNPKDGLELFVENNPSIPKDEKVYLAKLNGSILTEMKKDANNNFVYKMLPQDFKKLSTVEVEDDPFLAIKDFSGAKGKDIIIADNVYFEASSTELLPEAKLKLEKVANIMKDNPDLKVELSAHTDSKGDDNFNMKLSQERVKLAVEYITSKGVDPKRLSGKGYGESQLLNRCANGINCSEEEHKLNRRIEFKFSKN